MHREPIGRGEPIIVVSGLPRAGTSMVMNMLAAGGIDLLTDGVRTADDNNPRGYFEFEPVKGLAAGADTSWLNAAGGKALKIISYFLPFLPDRFDYRVIFVHRELTEVLQSQRKMLIDRGEPASTDDARMRDIFEHHLIQVHQALDRRQEFAVLELQHTDLLADPRGSARTISAFLQRPLDIERMAAVPQPELYRSRSAE